jgi:hypothetical protein
MCRPPRIHGRFALPALLVLLAFPGVAAAKAAPHARAASVHPAKVAAVSPAVCGGGRATAAQKRRDSDHDGIPNLRDADIDGDGIPNRRDGDLDGDRQRNGRDRDVDGDGIPNSRDRDGDGDGIPNGRDRDVDGDGILNARDPDVDGDGIPNARDADIDGDCVVNRRDPDSDGDGVPDTRDILAYGFSGTAAEASRARQASPARVPASFFGLVANEAMGTAPGAAQDAVTAGIRGAGAGTLRQKLDWATVERTPGVYTWDAFDALVSSAGRAGLQLLPILFNPPAFRSSDPGSDGTAPPADNATFAAFAAAAVQRYGPGGAFWAAHPELPAAPIHAWQVWNEPNFKAYWPSGPDPAAYAAMLRAVGGAIHAADAGADVVAAGLPDSYSGMSPVDFLDGMYAAGARGSFDTIAVHPYARSADEALAILSAVRDELDRHGDGAIPIWATELGWATGGPAAQYTVDEATQAQMVQRTLTALVAQRARLNLAGVVYYDWQDCGAYEGGSDFWGLHTGLHRIDGSPKPALAAFTQATQALTAA